MQPKLSYRIWFTQRSGSTLLSETLTAIGIAGKPGEHFGMMGATSPIGTDHLSVYEALREKLWEAGSTPNGVFGLKDAYHHTYYMKIFNNILQLRGIEGEDPNHEEILSDLFPNCRHIYLTRRNKIRQAVSWWKAIQDEVWHVKAGDQQEYRPELYEGKYNLEALKHLLKEIMLKECATQAYFEKYQIVPLSVVYEDFVRAPQRVIQRIVDYLEIPSTNLEVSSFPLRKTSNSFSEKWVQQLRTDLQVQNDPGPIW